MVTESIGESVNVGTLFLVALGGVGSVFNALCFFVLRGLRTDLDSAQDTITEHGERLAALEVICGVYHR